MSGAGNDAAAPPLAGIRVLDLTRLLPGPVATMQLADMGADVLKIEDPGAGDYARAMGPVRAEVSQFFVAVNRGKRFLRLDLKDPAQREQLLALVEDADVLVESFRPGVMAKLGLGWDVLRRRKPTLVMCAISGYGQDGPFAQLAGHDINYIGYAGMLANNAGPDGTPALPNLQVGDLLGGAQSALQGILAALLAVKMGGPGRFVDISMSDAVLAHNIMPLVAVNNGAEAAPARDLLTGGVPCYNVYRTADARFMAVGALELKFWQLCCDVLQRPDLKARHWQLGQQVGGADALAVKAELDAIFAGRSLAQWTETFAASDCCVTPILTSAEALRHPLFQARRMVSQERHPTEGVYWAVAHPIKFET
ncbi:MULTISPECIES: CaiB/BaiF CoA transferase family protein [unclassified Janthinobacterium]|uniref:CaiB/BaiF CoA transferase family protein n=1 Tax=unclassified Janthinobacterium TaxID=2610881 RepID=UPI0003460923|nr:MULTISPECIES: CaiB/BaiF CoA-transferase family protein [unclassified Janthinobacterium]MEC5164216.1 alpha-methylacyl-CoA racemase [Janthinobacterium sp. CG_S6]